MVTLLLSGWYTDVNRTELYVSSPVTVSTILYAGFAILHYTVNFYDDDQSLLKTTSVAYGSDAIPPADPSRASSVSFNYQFAGWQGSYTTIASNQDIIATYSQSFIPASASLLPGIDTIPAGSEWTDGGIALFDPSLTHVRSEAPDIQVPGTYTVIYSILLENQTVYSLERIITVTQGPTELVLTLLPGISTLLIGETYQEAGAESSLGTVIISGTVDTAVAGIYPIVYTVEYQNTIVQKTRYVFVIDPATSITVVMLPWKKDESGWIL